MVRKLGNPDRGKGEGSIIEPTLPKGGVEALRPYVGKWVAFADDGEIVASGKTADEVMSAAEKAGFTDPVFEYLHERGIVG